MSDLLTCQHVAHFNPVRIIVAGEPTPVMEDIERGPLQVRACVRRVFAKR